MKNSEKKYDCVIIGGGMFGLYAASFLSSKGAKVAIIEKEKSIFNRASKINQSRIHRGYHYPRSIETARKVSEYYNRFCSDFNFALLKPFKQYYAISKKNSKTSVNDYVRFCHKLNIPIKEVKSLLFFKKNVVDAIFETEESCFNYLKIKKFYLDEFKKNKNIDIYLKTFPSSFKITGNNYLLSSNISSIKLLTPAIINTTYSNVNEVNKLFGFSNYQIKYELCELLLYSVSKEFARAGLTVMDGSFFSLIPFANGDTLSLSSVNHTPINTNYFKSQNEELKNYKHLNLTEVEKLVKSYLKSDIDLTYKSSVFEIKPILVSSEEDDSRPTLITVHRKRPYFISVLAGKISTIYDLDESLKNLS